MAWGCCGTRPRGPVLPRTLANAPDPRAPRALTWQLPAVTPAAAARALRHLRLRIPLSTLFWTPWAPTCPEPDRQTPRIRKARDCLLHADCACPNPTSRGAARLIERLYTPGALAAEGQPMRSRAKVAGGTSLRGSTLLPTLLSVSPECGCDFRSLSSHCGP